MLINKRNFSTVLIACLFFVSAYNRAISSVPGLSFIQYVDELVVVLYIPISIWHMLTEPRKRLLTVFIWLFIIYAYFITYARGTHLSLTDLFAAGLINVKLILFFDIALMTIKDYNVLRKLIICIICFSCFGLLLNAAMGTSFNKIFGYDDDYRFDSLRIGGFEGNSNNLGLFVVVVFLYANFYVKNFKWKRFITSTLFFVIVCLFWIGSRSPFFVFLCIFFGYFLVMRLQMKTITLLCMPLIIALGVVFIVSTNFSQSQEGQLVQSNINSFEEGNQSKYLRAIMIVNGVELMVQNFPFGSGVGTFASVYANKYYNPIYQQIGLYGRSIIQDGGLYDSNFASILAEYGALGFIMFLSLFFFMCSRIRKSELPRDKKIYFYVLITYILYSFLIRATFNNSYPSIIFTTFFVILNDPKVKKQNVLV